MKITQIILTFVVVSIMFTLATVTSMFYEQHTAMAYFVGGIISQTIVLSISRDA